MEDRSAAARIACVTPMDPPEGTRRFAHAVAIRWTTKGARSGFAGAISLLIADVGSQLASPADRQAWFGVLEATAAVLSARFWSWF
jgi:hypothetical protein